MDDYDVSISMLTPIKKIRNLTLTSPGSPIRYPSMSDFPVKDSIFLNMVDKGYSQTLSDKVLRELDNRANEISMNLTTHVPKPATSKKRYSGAHRPLFSKMESISSHYAAARAHEDSSPGIDFASSATKKRRTLNGPEEMFGGLDKENDSPTRRKTPAHASNAAFGNILKLPLLAPGYVPNLAPSDSFSLHSSPTLAPAPLLSSPFRKESSRKMPSRDPWSQSPRHEIYESPSRIPVPNSSPTRRISPSKGSMNLNSLLQDDDGFAKPAVPKYRRQTSLQMAGVQPSLQKQPSLLNLQKKPSLLNLQKKPSQLNLQRPSIPNLHKRPSIPSLQKKPSIPSLQKKPSISSLQPRPFTPAIQKTSTGLQKKTSTTSLNRTPTVPKPFSLYDKPTISSSQKSLTSHVPESASTHSLSSARSVSQRSLSKFQKFKSRFS